MVPPVNGWQRQPELAAFLSGIPFFAPLDEAARLELTEQLEAVHVDAGDVVFTQGDAGDGLFLIVSGRVRVSVAARGTERVLADLGRGAIVGEMALLSDRPRSSTVRAVRDSDLVILRVSSFKALIERNPALLGAMARLLVDRLLAADRPQAPPTAGRTIGLVAAGRSTRTAATVAELLAAELARAGTVVRVDADAVERHLGLGAAQRAPSEPGRGELTAWLHTLERGNDHVIYEADAEDTPWSRICLSQSDVVVLAASVKDDPSIGPVEARALAAALAAL